ncbi:GXWXG protein [Blastococcus colisei]|uniref:GXWXG protein n=1 Tax=Blastococcus colisei TaxID=1564162 RepID=A0A543PD28_9ACTN|nr:DUF4334 domain-containing protein [Blastococcus colisei]TQN41983.1 GXWXG protein [Blastococcus colisei]
MTTLPQLSDEAAADWLERHRSGVAPEEALAFFDGLPPVPAADMLGRWRGSGLPTGSRLDGLLEAYGWYGKEVLGAEAVHPLLLRGPGGRPRAVDPVWIPLPLLRDHAGLARSWPVRTAFGRIRPLLHTHRHRARLRTIEHRGVSTAAMVYDALPIIDVFRRVGPDVVIGAMDMRGLPEPFFFLLERDTAADV